MPATTCKTRANTVEQYSEDVVQIEVAADGRSVGRRQLSYSFSSLDLARQLSSFYCRLLTAACQHHHQHCQQQQQSACGNVSDGLDKALVSVVDDEKSNVARRTLFTVYQHHSDRNNTIYQSFDYN